jgi:hypothetical protein
MAEGGKDMTDAPEKLWVEPDGETLIIHNGSSDLEALIATGYLHEYTPTDVAEAEYERGFGDGRRHIQEDYEAGEQLDLRAAQARIKELEAELVELHDVAAQACEDVGRFAKECNLLQMAMGAFKCRDEIKSLKGESK